MIKSKGMRRIDHVARMGQRRMQVGFLVGKPEGKRPLGIPGRRWEDNIKVDLRERSWGYMAWIYLAQDRDRWSALVSTAINPRVP
jgi:hypothetical protein